jgi:hypothetical protein
VTNTLAYYDTKLITAVKMLSHNNQNVRLGGEVIDSDKHSSLFDAELITAVKRSFVQYPEHRLWVSDCW